MDEVTGAGGGEGVCGCEVLSDCGIEFVLWGGDVSMSRSCQVSGSKFQVEGAMVSGVADDAGGGVSDE